MRLSLRLLALSTLASMWAPTTTGIHNSAGWPATDVPAAWAMPGHDVQRTAQGGGLKLQRNARSQHALH